MTRNRKKHLSGRWPLDEVQTRGMDTTGRIAITHTSVL